MKSPPCWPIWKACLVSLTGRPAFSWRTLMTPITFALYGPWFTADARLASSVQDVGR
jgi:hypothetical protein